ncbi:NYN domain-containing protein [Sphingobacterium oryzagri]|uniref:NYN domain-containing protein n=1 Tax=Sphingobacterium oryzagri TaxID=3025669 RepID=A0ABY7WCV0_9SPHI|nr:NYN domain-containing protein [Sphingobacterium sp. KACC 22765]WDF67295.1 NYN domain-containing protein [Sphingobacterium sp. KACC 22765]
MASQKDLKIAILIDADNVSSKKIEEIMNEVNRYGIPTIKRIYGDWTRPYVENWKNSLLIHAITPIQQYSYTQGKNSTDSALIIDAMDILHSDRVDGFCIVSSDSDFTRLATRLRESGKLVIGIGERKTPKPFIASCDKFIYVEILEKVTPTKKTNRKNGNNQSKAPVSETVTPEVPVVDTPAVEEIRITELDEDTMLMLKDAVDDTADESGWAFLGEIGSLIIKRKPDFDARNYGFEKTSHLFKSMKEDFEIDERTTEKSRIKLYYVRNIIHKAAAVSSIPAPTPEATEDDDTTPVILPSKGNKITADDVKKNQIRITKDFKALFPSRTKKVKVVIVNEFECRFSYRGDRSHVLNLGKVAATELGLAEGASFRLTKVDELLYKLEKIEE